MRVSRHFAVVAIGLCLGCTSRPIEPEVSPWRPVAPPSASPDGFVIIHGGTTTLEDVVTQKVHPVARLEDFEILDHPLTNREYQEFIQDAGYPSPPYWEGGVCPQDLLDKPVVMVSRQDAAAYLRWRSGREGRVYRLPTAAEFEYAARGGLVGAKYPWGNAPPEGRSNFDPDGSRRLEDWRRYLAPVKTFAPNGYGLYGMSGNVFQFVDRCNDPAVLRWKYRIDQPVALEQAFLGGSWNRGAQYLRVGFRAGLSAGIRSPEVGFRPVREPQGADWRVVPRRLVALPRRSGAVFLSWALLRSDQRSTRFNIYRAQRRDHAGFRINREPVDGSCYIDLLPRRLRGQGRLYYRVRPLRKDGTEGPASEWAGVSPESGPTSVVAGFATRALPGRLVPVFGDLNGDGALDCVVRITNGIHEMSQDPGVPVEMEAFASWGRSLWRRPLVWHDHCFGNHNNVPFNVYDLDRDGRAEIVTRLQQGDSVYLAVLDGWTGRILRKTPWPELLSDWNRSSTRIHLSVGYLDGQNPAIVVQTGLYENERITAFDANLRQLWDFKSTGLTNGSGSHRVVVADVDGDGCQEVFDGTTCLNADGSVRWSIYRHHPDAVSVHDLWPPRPGLEVFYGVETGLDAGVYLVDADSGRVLWSHNCEEDPSWTHSHFAWTADIWAGSPGYECLSNRRGHDDRNLLVYSADGNLLARGFPADYLPLEWDGDETRELISGDASEIAEFGGRTLRRIVRLREVPQGAQFLMAADLVGDFRDELVLFRQRADRLEVLVLASSSPCKRKWLARMESRDYRLWLARNMGGGYREVFDCPLVKLRSQ